ncbi:hypothetical protein FOMG_16416 [Fusarium oxysporum f. sp. melonis 26406]|uniref:Uncharacterized protein n=1 Tax=Fusarium oxysporum f. sp. melonis 26406 TaxID=1089452 RepID=X0A107_FUSOX|nr:hypothetical protein FOMG_16416 [Fusarium oxysporum f. sp. melonis 26406]
MRPARQHSDAGSSMWPASSGDHDPSPQRPATAIPPSSTCRTTLPCLLPPLLAPSHQRRDSWPQPPDPPQRWRGAEESMRDWLEARVEEDKRRQAEEKTKQESLRLERRKVEMDMLCTSLQGGVPPAMTPLIFVRMGSRGARPQMTGAQQFTSVLQAYHFQLLSPQHAHSKYQRDIPQPTQAAAPALASHPQIEHVQSSQQESQPRSSITFYTWQPPILQARSNSNRPRAPSASTKTKRQ